MAGGYASLTPVCILPPFQGFSCIASANPSMGVALATSGSGMRSITLLAPRWRICKS